jgi:hypothetical protein
MEITKGVIVVSGSSLGTRRADDRLDAGQRRECGEHSRENIGLTKIVEEIVRDLS